MESIPARTEPENGPTWFNAGRLLAGLRRLVMFCGAFGSGKTEVAVNFALGLRQQGRKVAVADLDIVNPYFRSREVREQLAGFGVDVIIPSEQLLNADLPIIQPEVRGALEKSAGHVVLDLGGDPVGARLMASFAGLVRPEELDGLFVLNSRRPRTLKAADAGRMMQEISAAAQVRMTGIVVNSHLVGETTAEVVSEGIALAEELAAATGVGIAFVTVERGLLERLDAAGCRYPVMVLERLMLKPWEPSNWLGKRRIN
ncbi:MAG: hypothetical protein ABIK86_01180 [candidate division WOR-3 bacterium]